MPTQNGINTHTLTIELQNHTCNILLNTFHRMYVSITTSSIGAVGSARVLCTRGPGFKPLMEHWHFCLLAITGEKNIQYITFSPSGI